MSLHLNHTNTKSISQSIRISGSKSESNRLLILQKLYTNISIKNISNSDDTQLLQKALTSDSKLINIGHAGTAMRFLTAYFAIQNTKTTILTGSKRMQERPIEILVDALRQLGAEIKYTNKEGFPPIEIKGKKLTKYKVSVAGNISSQYISALLLIAPSLPKGLTLELTGKTTSVPYIKMTLGLLNRVGVETKWKDNTIQVFPLKKPKKQQITVEPDWSSASYFYSLVALQPNSEIILENFKKESLQGDRVLADIYKNFGIATTFIKKGIKLKNSFTHHPSPITHHLINTPDIAQTIAVTCFGLGIDCRLTGLHTLKIKETDRLIALKTELKKLGAKVETTKDSLHVIRTKQINKDININTYQDHRMAMAFATLSVLVPINIKNPDVVSKSYTGFWDDWKNCFIQEI